MADDRLSLSDPAAPEWVSIAELAVRLGVSHQAVSKRVARLVDLGHLQTRKGPRGSKLIDPAAFDHAVTLAGDAQRALNGAGPAEGPPSAAGIVLSREQARKVATEADLRQLDLDERLGRVVPVDQVRQAFLEAGATIARIFDQLSGRLDDLLEVVAKEGRQAGKSFLAGLAVEARLALAEAAGEKAAAALKEGEA